jgi:hypothetical protein
VSKSRLLFLFLFVAHFFAVLLSNGLLHNSPSSGDPAIFLLRAEQFAHGNFSDPATNWNFAPGYSVFLLLSGVWNGFCLPLLIAAQCLVYAVAVFAFIRSQNLPQRSALIGLAALLFFPEILNTNGTIGPECLAASLLLFAFAELCASRNLLRLSTLLGLLCITRFEYALVLPVVVAMIYEKRAAAFLKKTALLFVFPVLFFALNGLRNYAIFGQFNPTSYGSGVVLYAGVNFTGDAAWHSISTRGYVPDEYAGALKGVLAQNDTIKRVKQTDSLFKHMSVEQWKSGTQMHAANIPVKLGRLWLVPGVFDLYTADTTFQKGVRIADHFSGVTKTNIKHGFYFALNWLALILAMLGMRKAPKRLRAFSLGAILVMSLAYAGIFYGLPRFHEPMMPLVLMLAVFSLTRPNTLEQSPQPYLFQPRQ